MNKFIKTSGTQKQSETDKKYKKMMNIFSKTQPAKVSEKQRTALILQANTIFNDGDIEKARTIYSALQYYSGMVRVAKEYYKCGKILEAYATFIQAGATSEAEKLAEHIANCMQTMLKT